jgi:cyclophilin family peptidyl-prolyl cis-trans isomerase
MHSVTRIGFFSAARGLLKACSAVMATVVLAASMAASLGAMQGAWAADPPAPAVAPAAAVPPITAVRVTTNMGSYVIELQSDRAPLTVANFVRYVNEGFYTNTLVHRVVGGFVVQGGGYDAATQKLKGTHDYVFNESGNGLQNKRGSVGMARSDKAHSANSQFYVNLADNSELDPLATRWGYAVFGQVIEGMDVIEKMGVVATGSVGNFKSEAPLKPLVIEKIEPLTRATATGTSPPSPPAAPTPPPPAGSAGEGSAPPPQ